MRKIFFPNKYRKTQIETPYTKLSQNELLDKFKTENWSKMTTDERINTLQELENRYALEQNRPVARVEAETVRSLGGSYSNFSNVIRVNVTDLPNNNSFEQLDSYYHESRHASQYQAMKTGKGIDQTTRNMCKVELDCGNYAGQGDDYDMQTCEMDSNNTASQKMLEHSERYKGDANYRTYLKSREEHFENVNKLCESKREYRFERHEKLIKRSQERGTLDKKELAQLESHIEKKEIEPVVKQSAELEKKLHAQNLELENNVEDKSIKQQHLSETETSSKRLENPQNNHLSFFEDNGDRNTKSVNANDQDKHKDFFESNGNIDKSENKEKSSSQAISNGNENAII